jgi:hypothetical protein
MLIDPTGRFLPACYMSGEQTRNIPMTEPRRSRGHPPFEPTHQQRQTVQVMRANGDPLTIIAKAVGGIDVKTLRKHFRRELEDGHAQVVASMGAALVRAGLAGNVNALRFWLLTRGGPEWRITERHEVGGLEGAPPITVSGEAKVVVYLPDNGRDRPDPDQ